MAEPEALDEDVRQLRHCRMCPLTVFPSDVANHPLCHNCSMLLEPEFNEKTLCRCGKYHNAPSLADAHYCRSCMGEEVPTGTPKGEPVRVEDIREFEEDPYL